MSETAEKTIFLCSWFGIGGVLFLCTLAYMYHRWVYVLDKEGREKERGIFEEDYLKLAIFSFILGPLTLLFYLFLGFVLITTKIEEKIKRKLDEKCEFEDKKKEFLKEADILLGE